MIRAPRAGCIGVLLIGLGSIADTAVASDLSVLACKAIDDAGGSNQLVIEVRDERVHAFRYRRSVGMPRCEIEASRSPSAYPWERWEWVDGEDASEIYLYSDDNEDAHVRIRRLGRGFELRVIDYDRWWLCGSGQYLNPVIAVRPGEDSCILTP